MQETSFQRQGAGTCHAMERSTRLDGKKITEFEKKDYRVVVRGRDG